MMSFIHQSFQFFNAMSRQKIDRRKFIKAGLAGVAVYTGFRAIDEGLKEIGKPSRIQGLDWFAAQDHVTKEGILDQIEARAMKETSIGDQTTESIRRSKEGLNIAGGQKLKGIEEKPYSFHTDLGGRLKPYTDEVHVRRPEPDQAMEYLAEGKPLMLERTHHELAHWMADQANPLEDTTDLLKDVGLELMIDQPISNIRDEIKLDSGGEPANSYTRFLKGFRERFHPGEEKELKHYEGKALDRLETFRSGVESGGGALMEVHARMLFMDVDYRIADPYSLRKDMFKQVRNYRFGEDKKIFNTAFDRISKLYALRRAGNEDPVLANQLAAKDIGEGLLSWDKQKKTFTELDKKVEKLSAGLGWSESRLEKEKMLWLKMNISERARDQATVRGIAEEVLLKERAEQMKKSN